MPKDDWIDQLLRDMWLFIEDSALTHVQAAAARAGLGPEQGRRAVCLAEVAARLRGGG
jgi:hypothetical protein